MKTRKETAELAAMLALRCMAAKAPHQIAADALMLSRLASAAESNALALCNGDRQQDAYDRKKESIERRANAIAAGYWLRAKCGGDPRGYCLRLYSTNAKRPLRGNTWGGDQEGYGV